MKSKIESLQKSDSQEIIEILEQRVRNIDYLENPRRNDSLDYIAAKVKAQIAPYLRMARTIRRGYYPRWVEFNKLLEYFDVKESLTRENNYSPLPDRVINHWDSQMSVALENHIFFFNKLHEIEDRKYERIFKRAFDEWAKPALIYAFNKVDLSKSEKEIVAYVCKTFYTKFIELRAASQGMNRKYRNGKWVYYYKKGVNEDEFRYNDVMQTIFHGEEGGVYAGLDEIAQNLTKRQTKLLIQLHDYVREDVKGLSSIEFYEKYRHGKMNYKRVSQELGYSYPGFTKNIERIRRKIV